MLFSAKFLKLVLPFCIGTFATIASTKAQEERLILFDERSRIGYAVIDFDAFGNGSIELKSRWCSTLSGACKQMTLPLPPNSLRYFSKELEVPRVIELDEGVTLTLSPTVNIDAELSMRSRFGTKDEKRQFQIARQNTTEKSVTSNRPRTIKISDLPRPLGAYALIENSEDLKDLGAQGDEACRREPIAFVRGRILFKQATDSDSTPFRTVRYMECSRFDDGPENCVMFSGTPEAPQPIGSSGGYDYSPVKTNGQSLGDFKMCPSKDPTNCAVLFACIRQGGTTQYDSTFPSGQNIAESMIARANGTPPFFRYQDNKTIQLERPAK